MRIEAVQSAYRRWAPIYDGTFGAFTAVGRRRAVDHINGGSGRVLEVGVGTGLSLEAYAPHLEVWGLDISEEMLGKARRRVAARKLGHVRELQIMDARRLDFADGFFDTVVAMYVVSVAPEPERVVSELARVCRPGGAVLIVGHFARDTGVLSVLEQRFASYADRLGWHSDFEIDTVLREPSLQEAERRPLPPFGMFTFLLQHKRAA